MRVRLLNYTPTEQEINDACMLFRHDFGLLDKSQQDELRLVAGWWLRAWGHTLSTAEVSQ